MDAIRASVESCGCLLSAAGDPCAGLVELGLLGFMLMSSCNWSFSNLTLDRCCAGLHEEHFKFHHCSRITLHTDQELPVQRKLILDKLFLLPHWWLSVDQRDPLQPECAASSFTATWQNWRHMMRWRQQVKGVSRFVPILSSVLIEGDIWLSPAGFLTGCGQ